MLYNRYVPPKRAESQPRTTSQRPETAPEVTKSSHGTSTTTAAPPPTNGLYARYVPQKTEKLSTNGSAQPQEETSSVPRKRKRQSDADHQRDQKEQPSRSAKAAKHNTSPLKSNAELQNGDALPDRSRKNEKPRPSAGHADDPDAQVASHERKTREHRTEKKEKKHSNANSSTGNKSYTSKETGSDAAIEDEPDQPRGKAAVMERFKEASKKSAKRGSQQRDETMDRPEKDEAPVQVNSLEPILLPDLQPDTSGTPLDSLASFYKEINQISTDRTPSFGELGISDTHRKILTERGLSKALPVQAGAYSALVPHTQFGSDVCLSAATGSGKTLAYVLPIMEHLTKLPNPRYPILRALIVVPTRELVAQVQKTFDMFTGGAGLQVGIALGNRPLAQEQVLLVERRSRPWLGPAKWLSNAQDDSGLDQDEFEIQDDDDDFAQAAEYYSRCQILIATPGRLVEHIRNTKGFSLSFLEWLVIDESDRLLDESFQEWTSVLEKAIKKRPLNRLATSMRWDSLDCAPKPTLRKVILSATMPSDLDKLSRLHLHKPVLLQVAGNDQSIMDTRAAKGEQVPISGLLQLPPLLEECGIPVGDGSEKPLFLVSLLQDIFKDEPVILGDNKLTEEDQSSDSDTSEASSTSSDDSSSAASSIEDSSSSDSDDSEDSDSDTSTAEDRVEDATRQTETLTGTVTAKPSYATKAVGRAVLIFTSTNESTARLHKLLTHLLPTLSPRLASLLKTTSAADTARILTKVRTGSLRVIIASDRVSRGLDVPALTDVVSYDVPRSVTAYVHRVGRTARAGRAGKAWTLTERKSAGWFWHVVAKGEPGKDPKIPSTNSEDVRIGRAKGQKVRKLRLTDVGKGAIRERYETALEQLKQDVTGQ